MAKLARHPQRGFRIGELQLLDENRPRVDEAGADRREEKLLGIGPLAASSQRFGAADCDSQRTVRDPDLAAAASIARPDDSDGEAMRFLRRRRAA